MSTYSFFATVHVDRFSDLALVVGDHAVIVDVLSMGDDSTIDVEIEGEPENTRRLARCLQKIKHILSSAPVVEEV